MHISSGLILISKVGATVQDGFRTPSRSSIVPISSIPAPPMFEAKRLDNISHSQGSSSYFYLQEGKEACLKSDHSSIAVDTCVQLMPVEHCALSMSAKDSLDMYYIALSREVQKLGFRVDLTRGRLNEESHWGHFVNRASNSIVIYEFDTGCRLKSIQTKMNEHSAAGHELVFGLHHGGVTGRKSFFAMYPISGYLQKAPQDLTANLPKTLSADESQRIPYLRPPVEISGKDGECTPQGICLQQGKNVDPKTLPIGPLPQKRFYAHRIYWTPTVRGEKETDESDGLVANFVPWEPIARSSELFQALSSFSWLRLYERIVKWFNDRMRRQIVQRRRKPSYFY